MKKVLMTLMLCFSFLTMTNAQIATENSKVFDNVSIGVGGGVMTPMNFNSMFPLNPVIDLRIQKNFSPSFGLQVEGLAILNDNNLTNVKTAITATNVGANAVINLSNAIWGYKGTPRIFEINAVGGLGWLYTWNTSKNNLSSKTGLDLAFNIGKKRTHSLVLSPAIYWNLNETGKVQFNKNYAQLGLTLSYIYHFKTSNGTHHFKTYDVGAMIDEIDRLNEELAKKPKEVEVIKYVEVIKVDTVNSKIMTPTTYVIQFAQNSSVLSKEAKTILDGITGNVNIKASASPEGTKNYNKKLSERRAAAVAEYLTKKGVKVGTSDGVGSVDNNSNRIAVITCY